MAQTLLVPNVPDDIVQRLDARLRETGKDRSAYLLGLLERDLQIPSLDDLLAPFRSQVAASGLSDEELDSVFREAREEVHQAGRDA